MNAPTEFRITEEGGRKYAVLPLERYTELVERAGGTETLTLPHAVAARHLTEDVSLVKAWREHLGLTQADLAKALGVSQAQIAQWERPEARPRHTTLKRLAAVMGLHVAQLTLNETAHG